MVSFFDINYVIFSLWGYNMSLIELVGTIFGLFSVWLAARSSILTWPATLVNTVAFFLVFYQIRLYSDMLLQIYFFAIAIYGWYYWSRAFTVNSKPIRRLSKKGAISVGIVTALGTVTLTILVGNLDNLLPSLFPEPASFVFVNAFTVTLSVIANFLMARRLLENWFLWIVVDVFCVVVYAAKGIWLMSFEYFILMIICLYGYRSWKVEHLKKSEYGD